jgi:hypothetical protein
MNVALIIFNRPRHTERVLLQIAKAKPEHLFVIADGPRPDHSEDATMVQETRSLIDRVDWPCRIYKNYSETNLGCGLRPLTGISWVFEQVERCIILEDDCVPDLSFFRFCDELLERYADDPRVGMISGDNFFKADRKTKGSYFLSVYPLIWGWATWRRAWNFMDFEMRDWPKLKGINWLSDYLHDAHAAWYWSARFDYCFGGKHRDIWDVAWVFACWRSGGATIHPCVNLVRNIGWGAESTHTNENSRNLDIAAETIPSAIIHPNEIIIDRKRDRLLFSRFFAQKPGICARLMSRYTYGAIIRSTPLIGRVWAAWRKWQIGNKYPSLKR